MRISACVVLPAALLAAAAAFAPRPAAAYYNLPWCAYFYENDVESCAYTSWEQCFSVVRGPVGGHCTPNPYYAANPAYGPRHHAGRRRARSRTSRSR